MKKFKKDLLKICNKHTGILIMVFILSALSLVFGLLMHFVCYMSPTPDSEGRPYLLFYFTAIIFGSLGTFVVRMRNKQKAAIKNKIAILEQTGVFQQIYNDFTVSQHIFSSKLSLAISNHFLLDFTNYKEGFSVIPLNNITNVFKCNMLNNEPTTTTYLALETADGERRLITSHAGKNFEMILAQLRANINQGGVTTWMK